jgi:hypothetical protein
MRTLALLSLSGLIACGGDTAPPGASAAPRPDGAAAEVAAGRLCSLFQRIGDSCDWSGTSVVVGDLALVVSAEVTQEVKAGSALSLSTRYAVSVDGKDHGGLVGRGSGGGASREQALEKAADDWARVFGVSVVDAVRHQGRLAALQSLQDDQSPPPAFVQSGWAVYPGYTDLRGTRTEAKMIDIREILALLDPTVQGFGEGIHGITIQFERRGTAYTADDCLVDGRPSAEVCSTARTYGWPEGSYLLEQHFTFVAGGLPEGVAPRTYGAED